MTSVLNVDTIADKAGTGPVTLTKQEGVKARLMFDQVNTNIKGSLNISSVSDSATGQYVPTFTSNVTLGYATTAVSANTSSGQNDTSVRGAVSATTQLTTSYKVLTYTVTTAVDDELTGSITSGDLA